MKNTILSIIIALCAICVTGTAQVKLIDPATQPQFRTIGELRAMGNLFIKLSATTNTDTTFVFIEFKDVTYPTLNDFVVVSFIETGKDINTLYRVIRDGLRSTKSEDEIQLPDGILKMKYQSQLGVRYAQFLWWVNGRLYVSTLCNEKRLVKLFGEYAN